MRKIHSLGGTWTPDEILFFSKLGFLLPHGFGRIAVPEDERYFRIRDFFVRKGKSIDDFIVYHYSKEEIQDAPYCILNPYHTSGYPKPESSYLSRTYNLNNMCPTCHVGKKQRNSFSVGTISKHGFWGFTSWEFDVRFVRDDIYDKVFAPYGIPRLPVKRASSIIDGLSQLVIPITDESLDLYPFQYEICPDCGSKRYLPGEWDHRPFFPLHKHPLPGIYMTKEVFGQGWEVYHLILASSEVVQKLLSLKEMHYFKLQPCTVDIGSFWRD